MELQTFISKHGSQSVAICEVAKAFSVSESKGKRAAAKFDGLLQVFANSDYRDHALSIASQFADKTLEQVVDLASARIKSDIRAREKEVDQLKGQINDTLSAITKMLARDAKTILECWGNDGGQWAVNQFPGLFANSAAALKFLRSKA